MYDFDAVVDEVLVEELVDHVLAVFEGLAAVLVVGRENEEGLLEGAEFDV